MYNHPDILEQLSRGEREAMRVRPVAPRRSSRLPGLKTSTARRWSPRAMVLWLRTRPAAPGRVRT